MGLDVIIVVIQSERIPVTVVNQPRVGCTGQYIIRFVSKSINSN